MGRKRSDRRGEGGNQRYHDRVAARYDDIYRDDYWEAQRELGWSYIKKYLPSDYGAPILDAGCGTGELGIRLAKSGFHVTLLDLSQKMLDVATRKAEELGVTERVRIVQADLQDLSALGDGSFALVVSEGDPLSFVEDPLRALREIARTLRLGGVLTATVDHFAAGFRHFLERGDLDGLERFARSGRTEWLAERREERFSMRMFRLTDIEKVVAQAGLTMIEVRGRTVLPLREFGSLLEDSATRRRLLDLERDLSSDRSLAGAASHLFFAARKPVGGA
ncbi:MAG: class I SAM-dependent methyltransferase [Planctomycetes bacterium]|nr:class I SAM-dependent methyltransferase [Planctomycetota bacterium]MBI3846458.1 class I SAM-dependent methyltransferase [Planctomycetota bacterium]